MLGTSSLYVAFLIICMYVHVGWCVGVCVWCFTEYIPNSLLQEILAIKGHKYVNIIAQDVWILMISMNDSLKVMDLDFSKSRRQLLNSSLLSRKMSMRT